MAAQLPDVLYANEEFVAEEEGVDGRHAPVQPLVHLHTHALPPLSSSGMHDETCFLKYMTPRMPTATRNIQTMTMPKVACTQEWASWGARGSGEGAKGVCTYDAACKLGDEENDEDEEHEDQVAPHEATVACCVAPKPEAAPYEPITNYRLNLG